MSEVAERSAATGRGDMATRLERTRRAIARRIVEHIRNDTSDLGDAPRNDSAIACATAI
jgi:hypothetical protein